MTGAYELGRLQGTVEMLGRLSGEAQLTALMSLCQSDGVWTIPEDPTAIRPCLFEISALGVCAFAETIEELPRNWIKAARNTLNGLGAVA